MDVHLTLDQLQRFSDCLAAIYDEPTGENPVDAILDALDTLVPIDSMAVNETRGDGVRLTHHRHITSRRPELMDARPEVMVEVAPDHPLIQHVLHHGPKPCLRLSDFVGARELRHLSLYAFNNAKHAWRDQTALLMEAGSGRISIALNRDRVFSDAEFCLMKMLQPHVQRVLARCGWFVKLPGSEHLTCREREVLYWITQGKQDGEISLIIGCAERTVRQHTRAILRKLGVENRTSAIAAVLSGRAHAAQSVKTRLS